MKQEQFDALPELFKEIIVAEKALFDMLGQKVIPFANALWRIQRQRDLRKSAARALHWDNKRRG